MITQTSELELVLKTSGVESNSAIAISSAMTPFFVQAEEWKDKVAGVTDPKVARASRLVLKKIRVDASKKKDELKENVIKVGKTIDAAFRLIEGTISPMEEALEGVERAAERAEQARIAKIKSDREAALSPYNVVTTFFDLANMPQDVFEALLADKKSAYEGKIEAAKKAEDARIEKEKADALERVRIKEENERLKQEAIAREAIAKAEREKAAKEKAEAEFAAKVAAEASRKEREFIEAKAAQERMAIEAKADAERKIATEKSRKEREQAELLTKKEREAREKLEDENRRRIAAEDARISAERESARKAKAAPDKEKILVFAALLESMELPECSTKECKAIVEMAKNSIHHLASSVRKNVEVL